MSSASLPLPFDSVEDTPESALDARDRAGRQRAVDPRFNVALQASAGTGKTRVLVDRYVNLLRAGVDPSNVLAITFTRKAAAEMRERIITTLRVAATRGEIPPARWRDLRDRLGEIAISTIDAFCLSLLREFPLEADVDPGFRMADDTEVPRLVDEALDRALRICRSLARDDEHVALVFAQLGERRARRGLSALLSRRIVAPALLDRYLASGPRDLTAAAAGERAIAALDAVFAAMPGGLDGFLDCGPIHPAFMLLAHHLRAGGLAVADGGPPPTVPIAALLARVRDHFLTLDGEPRKQLAVYKKDDFATERDYRRHRDAVVAQAPEVARVLARYRHDLNVIVSRGVRRMFQVALTEYRRTLDAHAVLDFPDVLLRALDLLRQMDEFAQSRFRLESRYHHILVDEFQDTSHAQWELVSLLVRSWGEGSGVAHAGPVPPSIFVVGDPKQSIYGFRDADASILEEAGRFLEGLRPEGDVRRAISRSFRSVPAILAFVNDVCAEIAQPAPRRDAFRYAEDDRFPIDTSPLQAPVLGLIAADTAEGCAARTAAEVERLLRAAGHAVGPDCVVRDRDTGVARAARPGDIAILFRTRDSHRAFEDALEARGIPAYVYKGLGFFDADEIKDMLALLWYLADPLSDLRAAAFLRSRVVGLSDVALRMLAPRLAEAIVVPERPPALDRLDPADRSLIERARACVPGWLALADRLPPAELLDRVLTGSGYAVELRGARLPQGRENLKKFRALVRRIQNRGYITLARVADYIDRLSVGDESNAAIDALDAVNLMTVHAAKGLEFPVVFVVNLARGTGSWRDPIRVSADGDPGAPVSVAIGDFQSEADEDRPARDQEETKRLLYVALTRARDRLYLASVVADGQLQPGQGSLAEVMPTSLLALFPQASAPPLASPDPGSPIPDPSVIWRGPGGEHRFAVCAAETPPATEPRAAQIASGVDDFAPIVEESSGPRAVVQPQSPSVASVEGPGAASDRLLGSLVHRLIERVGVDAAIDDVRLLGVLPELLRSDEQVEAVAIPALPERVIRAYRGVCERQDVRALMSDGASVHEIPFSLDEDGAALRGTIDCLVRSPDGTITVLEFKTGRPRPEHQDQLGVYQRAAERLFPRAPVRARLIYTSGM